MIPAIQLLWVLGQSTTFVTKRCLVRTHLFLLYDNYIVYTLATQVAIYTLHREFDMIGNIKLNRLSAINSTFTAC